MSNKNLTGGDFSGGLPKDCFPFQNSVLPATEPTSVNIGSKPMLPNENESDRLEVVMARLAAGGGHLTDRRHLGDMPNYRPKVMAVEAPLEKKTVYARGQWIY